MKTGIELIAEERQEQIEKHGRSVERDVKENPNKELRDGASVLMSDFTLMKRLPENWQGPIMKHALKKSYKDRLIIAGALIAAELDRINQTK